jgi:hypothetical protein
MTDLLARLKNVVRNGDGWTARCPAHDDQRNSLSIHHRDGRWLLNCHAGCGFKKIIGTLGMSAVDFFDDEPGQQGHGGKGALLPPNNTRNRATLVTHTATGLTLAQYAMAPAAWSWRFDFGLDLKVTASAGNREPSPAFMACTVSQRHRRLARWC